MTPHRSLTDLARLHYRCADLPEMAVLTVIYTGLSYGVSLFFMDSNFVSVLWPCSGLAIALLLLGGFRYVPVILIGELSGNLLAGYSPQAALALSFINTLEYFTTFWLLTRHTRFDLHVRRGKDFLSLALVGGAVGAVSALIASFVLLAEKLLMPDAMLTGVFHWWQGDLVGIILVTPMILIWKDLPRGWLLPERRVETLALLLLTVLAGQIIFLDWLHTLFHGYARGFVMIIFLTWAAARYGRHGALLVILLIATQSLVGAVTGVGYFGDDISQTGAQNLWLYLIILTIAGISLALKVESQQMTTIELQESRQRLQKFLHQVEKIRDDERRHMAREIHDELGQMLTAIKLEASALKRKLDKDSSTYSEVDNLRSLADQSIKVVRNITSSLRPPVLDLGLQPAIAWLTERFERNMKVTCNLETDGLDVDIDEKIATSAFRIVQEALTNIARHADATEATVTLNLQESLLLISVSDNGQGFDTNAPSLVQEPGIGLAGMAERAESLGGRFEIFSAPGQGTSIKCILPLPEEGTAP